jgi:SAM-dependent methyltransferase
MDFARFAENPRELARLQERFKRIITANKRDHIEGKRVLDLAASNGRWSCAAAEAGASEVVAVEGREPRVRAAIEEAKRLGFSDRCRFITGDMYGWLYDNRNERFDTVFCLGVYYHVMDHYQLLKLIARLQPNCIIIDSGFVRSFQLAVHVQSEDPSLRKNALPVFEGQAGELVGLVSLGMMNQMAWNCGYVVEPVVWDPQDVVNKQSVKDYMAARRYTLRLLRQTNLLGSDQKWHDRWRPALRALNPKYEQLLDPDKAHLVEDPRVLGRKAAARPAHGRFSLSHMLNPTAWFASADAK